MERFRIRLARFFMALAIRCDGELTDFFALARAEELEAGLRMRLNAAPKSSITWTN